MPTSAAVAADPLQPPLAPRRDSMAIAATPDGRVTLPTLLALRWIAIFGQLAAVLIAIYQFHLVFAVEPVVGCILASVALNAVAQVQRGPNGRLPERSAALYLCYDLIQLSALLYFTGGSQSPFITMLLWPVVVAATILSRASTVGVTALSIGCAFYLTAVHQPLPLPPGGLRLDVYFTWLWAGTTLTILFSAVAVWSVALESRKIYDALAASQVALAREQRLSSLGALAAAAAHELGSPLGTIALVAKEMASEVDVDDPLYEDIQLLIGQSQRCSDILKEISQRPTERLANPFDTLPLHQLVREAGAPHRRTDIALEVEAAPGNSGAEPMLLRTPEMMHGLGNLLQNAQQFAASRVSVQLRWSPAVMHIDIADDGPGFPTSLLTRIGEPYISTRPGAGGMGLGIFIAQTLLERSGARLHFGNGPKGGASISIDWQRPVEHCEVDPASAMLWTGQTS